MPKSIWDTRFTRSKPPMALDAAVVDALFALDDWITIHGAHVEIDGDGNVLHGAGGKFNGTNYYRHMNEKARAAKGELSNYFNAAEYKSNLKNAITKNEAAAEKEVMDERKSRLAAAEESLEQARKDYQKARNRGLTPRGLRKYEGKVREAEDKADRLRSPEQLREMAQAERDRGGINNSEYYDRLATSVEYSIESAVRDRIVQRVRASGNFSDVEPISGHGERSERANEINKSIEASAKYAEEGAKYEALERRANTRIEQLYESGQYPKEVDLYAETDGSIHLDPGTGAAGTVVETPDQVKQGIADYGKVNEPKGQKSIFGGSGWW